MLWGFETVLKMRGYNSTIRVKQKICVRCGRPCVWFSKKRCQQCARIEDTIARDEEEVEQDESLQNLVEDADVWFSKYIRLLYASSDGMVECYTSGKKMRWQEIQCGHFISRKHFATRWMPDNCRPQSEYENCHLHGNMEVFRKKLEQERSGLPEWLEEQAREVCKPTRDELKQLIIEYRGKVKMLEMKLKNPLQK